MKTAPHITTGKDHVPLDPEKEFRLASMTLSQSMKTLCGVLKHQFQRPWKVEPYPPGSSYVTTSRYAKLLGPDGVEILFNVNTPETLPDSKATVSITLTGEGSDAPVPRPISISLNKEARLIVKDIITKLIDKAGDEAVEHHRYQRLTTVGKVAYPEPCHGGSMAHQKMECGAFVTDGGLGRVNVRFEFMTVEQARDLISVYKSLTGQ